MREEKLGGLTARIRGGTDGRGGGDGPVVVLLHGWAAPGDDLAPLADVLDAPPGTRFLFPEGPLSIDMGFGESRAWWMIDVRQLNEHFTTGRPRNLSREVPKGMAEARERVLALLEDAGERLNAVPERMVLGGFSQGAMLACDVALRSHHAFAGLAVLSGTVLARDEWLPLLSGRRGLRVLQSHGRSDNVLPYFLAEQLRELLSDAGVIVDWVGFDGGHEIPETVLNQLTAFLHKVF